MVKGDLAPVVLFVYNRPDHTKKTIVALKNNLFAEQSDLIIFSDAPKSKKDLKKVNEVREYISSVTGFKSIKIIKRKKNFGLANSIVDGVTKVVNKYGEIIVLEDDLVTSKYFLKFMNDSLEMYKNESKVISISGYTYPVGGLSETFFIKGADCWGWATWKRGWKLFQKDGKKLLLQLEKKKLINEFDFNNSYPYTQMLKDQIEGKNNSWAVRWYASVFLKNGLILHPSKSIVMNIGNDATGTHNKTKSNGFDVILYENPINVKRIPAIEDFVARKKFEQFFTFKKSLFGRICLKISSLL